MTGSLGDHVVPAEQIRIARFFAFCETFKPSDREQAKVKLRPIDVYAIYPADSPKDGLARLFIDFMMDQIWATEYGFGLR